VPLRFPLNGGTIVVGAMFVRSESGIANMACASTARKVGQKSALGDTSMSRTFVSVFSLRPLTPLYRLEEPGVEDRGFC